MESGHCGLGINGEKHEWKWIAMCNKMRDTAESLMGHEVSYKMGPSGPI